MTRNRSNILEIFVFPLCIAVCQSWDGNVSMIHDVIFNVERVSASKVTCLKVEGFNMNCLKYLAQRYQLQSCPDHLFSYTLINGKTLLPNVVNVSTYVIPNRILIVFTPTLDHERSAEMFLLYL